MHLFLVSLAHAIGPRLHPNRQGYQQIYHALCDLVMDMTYPVPTPGHSGHDFKCTLPNIRILDLPWE